MLHFYRYWYQGNEGVEEIYVAWYEDMNADTEESALLEENALIPLLDVENDNTNSS